VETLFEHEHKMTLKQVVEALVFASPKPLTLKEIVSALKSAGNPEKTDDPEALEFAKSKEVDVEAALMAIAQEMTATQRSFRLMEQVNGWSFVTDPAAVHWVRQLYPEAKPARLTGPQLETLAIIAYRQPVTRADIEAVRGVAVDSVVQALMERSLIKIAGRAEVPGRPLLYETTEYFLQHFGLKTVNELPNAQELRRVELPKAPVPEEPATDAAQGDQTPKAERKKKGAKSKEQPPTAAEVAPEAASESQPAPDEALAQESQPDQGEGAEPTEEAQPDAAVPTDETVPDEGPTFAEAAPVEEPDPEPAEVLPAPEEDTAPEALPESSPASSDGAPDSEQP
jgi:segregation and condensation protein B